MQIATKAGHFGLKASSTLAGFLTGTKAAAAGGTTTVVLMPLNAHPAIVTGELLQNVVVASKVRTPCFICLAFIDSLTSGTSPRMTPCPGVETVHHKIDILVQDKLWVDAGYWGGLVPNNAANHSVLDGLLDAGALGFKSFMSPAGDYSHHPSISSGRYCRVKSTAKIKVILRDTCDS